MTGGELAVVIGAIVGGFGALGALIIGVVNVLVNARTKSMDEQLDHMGQIINQQHQADLTIINDLRSMIEYQGGQVKTLMAQDLERQRSINNLTDENKQLCREKEEMQTRFEAKFREQDETIAELRKENVELRDELTAYKTGKKATAKPGTGALKQ